MSNMKLMFKLDYYIKKTDIIPDVIKLLDKYNDYIDYELTKYWYSYQGICSKKHILFRKENFVTYKIKEDNWYYSSSWLSLNKWWLKLVSPKETEYKLNIPTYEVDRDIGEIETYAKIFLAYVDTYRHKYDELIQELDRINTKRLFILDLSVGLSGVDFEWTSQIISSVTEVSFLDKEKDIFKKLKNKLEKKIKKYLTWEEIKVLLQHNKFEKWI